MRYLNRDVDYDANQFEGGMVNISGYEPSDRAVMAVAGNCERSFVRLNRDVVYSDAATSLAMREMMGVTASSALAHHLSQMVPEATERINAIAQEHGQIAVTIMRGWRRNNHD